MKKQTILFVGANPHVDASPGGIDPLAVEREMRAIQKELRGSGHRDHFDLKPLLAAQPLDLLPALRRLKPMVVHLSARAEQGGVVFHADDGGARVVTDAALADAFDATEASVKVVVLSSCYNDALAEALLAQVECVIGVGESIHPDAARIFGML